jgi:hypothetical protein
MQDEDDLQAAGFLFQKPTPNNVLANCGAARDWPDARGIFHNKDKTFLVWVNEEDHMRCIAMENGGNVKNVFARFARAINSVEKSLNKSGFGYAHSEHLGYITTCPSNVGTGLRGSVMLKLPKLYKKMGVHALEVNHRPTPPHPRIAPVHERRCLCVLCAVVVCCGRSCATAWACRPAVAAASTAPRAPTASSTSPTRCASALPLPYCTHRG